MDASTLFAVIYGFLSAFLLKALPAKDGPMVLITYALPLVAAAIAVLIIDGPSGFSWVKYLTDVAAIYAANQATFQGAKVVAPSMVTEPPKP